MRVFDDNELSGLASINVEPRRRRRSSSNRLHEIESGSHEIETSLGVNLGQPMRAGAKRKLSMAYDTTDYRPSQVQQQTASAIDLEPSPAATEQTDGVRTQASPIRSALAPKPINNDPVVSPRKSAIFPKDKAASGKPRLVKASQDAPKSRAVSSARLRIEDTDKSRGPEVMEILPTVEIKTEPKTPSASDLLSPALSQSAATQLRGRATPPPTALSKQREDSLKAPTAAGDGAGVASRARRNRASVSYAEPSLVSKMRRPGKEMVDAVSTTRSQSDSVEPQVISRSEDNEDGRINACIQSDSPSRDRSKSRRPSETFPYTSSTDDGAELPTTVNCLRDSAAEVIATLSRAERVASRPSGKSDSLETAIASMDLRNSSSPGEPDTQEQIKSVAAAVGPSTSSSRSSRRQTVSDATTGIKERPSSRETIRAAPRDVRLSRTTSASGLQAKQDNAASRRKSMML